MRRLIVAIAAGLVGLAAIFWFVRFLVGQDLGDAANWADVIAGLLAALTVVVSIVWFLVRPSPKPLPNSPPTPRLVFGAIPREARWFQKRPAEQDALKKALADKKHVGLVALPGARGAGKTQLAAAYASAKTSAGSHWVWPRRRPSSS